MTTQYGFTSTPAVALGAKLASWPVRISKTYLPMSASGVSTNMPVGIGSKIMVHGTRMCSRTISLSPVITVVIPPVPRYVRVAQCISVMMVSL